jgi:hypothetical protein
MNRQNVLVVALVAILLTPVAAAYGPTSNSTPATGEPTDSTAPAADDGNYTRLYIDDGYRYSEVKPGESTTYNITVGNGEDEAVELDPHVVLPVVEGRPIEESWITIEDADTTLEADEERTFTVTVSVPADVELGDYRAQIAFTNQTISYQGMPERPVHAATIGVEVFEEPSVTIKSQDYTWSQVRAGDSWSYEIVVENTGDEAVPLNPKLNTRDSRYGSSEETVDRSWFDIEAPNEVEPGETATVTVTVSPPESAAVGDYNAEIDLGLTDPARPDRGDYWQRVNLHLEVWKQPAEPYETSFQVSEDTDDVTLTLSAPSMDDSSDRPVSFDVAFVAPNGTVVDHERVTQTTNGHVSLGSGDRRGSSQGPYSAGREQLEFTYRVDDPEAGQWTLEVLPQNTMDFSYEIVRNESAD